jgi:hypothetical protein
VSTTPKSARAMPTEQRIRYFQPASRDSRLRKNAIKKVVARVVPSNATHCTPRLFATVAATIANRNIWKRKKK